jgi:hypothetical protein
MIIYLATQYRLSSLLTQRTELFPQFYAQPKPLKTDEALSTKTQLMESNGQPKSEKQQSCCGRGM